MADKNREDDCSHSYPGAKYKLCREAEQVETVDKPNITYKDIIPSTNTIKITGNTPVEVSVEVIREPLTSKTATTIPASPTGMPSVAEPHSSATGISSNPMGMPRVMEPLVTNRHSAEEGENLCNGGECI